MLGVHVYPELKWKGQFKVMKMKIVEAINKLQNAVIPAHLIYLYFNTYLLKRFFQYRIIKLMEE